RRKEIVANREDGAGMAGLVDGDDRKSLVRRRIGIDVRDAARSGRDERLRAVVADVGHAGPARAVEIVGIDVLAKVVRVDRGEGRGDLTRAVDRGVAPGHVRAEAADVGRADRGPARAVVRALKDVEAIAPAVILDEADGAHAAARTAV